MVRTVRVRLELDRSDYKQGLRDAANDTRTFDGEVRSAGKDLGAMGVEAKATSSQVEAMGREADTAARSAKGLGDEVDKAKQKTTGLGEETRKTKQETTGLGDETAKTRSKIVDLTRDIDKAKASLKEMGDEFRKTGQIDISKFNEASRALRELERAKADLDKLGGSDKKNGSIFASLFKSIPNSEIKAAGTEAGKTFASGVQGSLSTPVLGPILIAGLVGVAVAAAPFFGAALAGGALGGAGLGAIGTGIILQLDRVKPAALDLAQYAKAQLIDATSSFGPAASAGLNALKREMTPFWSDIRQGLQSLTPYVSNLLVRLGEGLAKLGPGLGRALEAAGPILGAISKNIPTLLNGINIFFDQVSKGGKGAAEAIDALMKIIAGAAAALGFMVRGLANAFDFVIQAADKVSGIMAKIPVLGKEYEGLHNYVHGIATSFDESKLSAEGAAGGIDQFATSADTATGASGGLSGALGATNQSLQTLQGTMMSADQAAGQWRQGLLGLADGVKQHGTSLKENTTDGEANIQMLQDMVTKAAAVRDANVAQGQSVAYADDQYSKNIQTLIDNAVHLGFNRDQVQALIDKYKQVPGDVDTSVVLNGVVDAITKGQTLATILNNLDGKVSRAAVITTYRTIYQEQHYSSVEQGRSLPTYGVPSRWGNLFEHAAVGKLREASMYSAASPGRYVIAEPETGGEAFVPRRGDYGRSMSILNHAAAWYGARVVPAGAGGGVANVTVNVNAGMGVDGPALGRQIAAVLRPYIRSVGGGNVQVALGRG